MTRILVLGLGNDLLSDDAVGLRAAQVVQQRLGRDPRIDVRLSGETGLALLDHVVGCESLVLVDSIQTGRHPAGYVHVLGFGHVPAPLARSPHALGLAGIFRVAARRGLPMPRRVRIVAVEITDPYSLGTDMTPEVNAAIDDAADIVVQLALEFAATPVLATVR